MLLATAEFTSPCYGLTNLIIDKKKLRVTAFFVSILFLLTMAITINGVIVGL